MFTPQLRFRRLMTRAPPPSAASIASPANSSIGEPPSRLGAAEVGVSSSGALGGAALAGPGVASRGDSAVGVTAVGVAEGSVAVGLAEDAAGAAGVGADVLLVLLVGLVDGFEDVLDVGLDVAVAVGFEAVGAVLGVARVPAHGFIDGATRSFVV